MSQILVSLSQIRPGVSARSVNVARKVPTARRSVKLRAADEEATSSMVSEVPPPPPPMPSMAMSSDDIKAALLDTLFGVERGVNADSEIRAEINELITQLEAQNPTPSPTESMEMLTGNWKLMYTSSPFLLSILGTNRLPFLEIGDITQRIDGPSSSVENKLSISVPFGSTSFATQASLEVRSPKRLQLKVNKGVVEIPTVYEDIEVPESVSIMGQSVDLSQARSALAPFQDAAQSAATTMKSFLQQQSDLQIPIDNERTMWLLTTYLDEDTRISRQDGGAVFVFVKDVSISPTS